MESSIEASAKVQVWNENLGKSEDGSFSVKEEPRGTSARFMTASQKASAGSISAKFKTEWKEGSKIRSSLHGFGTRLHPLLFCILTQPHHQLYQNNLKSLYALSKFKQQGTILMLGHVQNLSFKIQYLKIITLRAMYDMQWRM